MLSLLLGVDCGYKLFTFINSCTCSSTVDVRKRRKKCERTEWQDYQHCTGAAVVTKVYTSKQSSILINQLSLLKNYLFIGQSENQGKCTYFVIKATHGLIFIRDLPDWMNKCTDFPVAFHPSLF